VAFTSLAEASADRTEAKLTDERRREDARVRLRPDQVVFALRDVAMNDASISVGKHHRTHDAAPYS
jgi:hypothetical protein